MQRYPSTYVVVFTFALAGIFCAEVAKCLNKRFGRIRRTGLQPSWEYQNHKSFDVRSEIFNKHVVRVMRDQMTRQKLNDSSVYNDPSNTPMSPIRRRAQKIQACKRASRHLVPVIAEGTVFPCKDTFSIGAANKRERRLQNLGRPNRCAARPTLPWRNWTSVRLLVLLCPIKVTLHMKTPCLGHTMHLGSS